MAMSSRNLSLLKVLLFVIPLGFFGFLSYSPKSADITATQNLYQLELKSSEAAFMIFQYWYCERL